MLKILKAYKTREQLLKQIFQKKTVKDAILNLSPSNLKYLNENLEKFPDQFRNLRFPSKVLKQVVDKKILLTDPKLKQEIIFLWGQRAFNVEDLENYIEKQVLLPHENFDGYKIKLINKRFDKLKRSMNVQALIKYLRYRSAIQKCFVHKEINEIIADKLQYEDQSALFNEFYDIGFFSNNYVYSLIELGIWEELASHTDKQDLYNKLIKNSVYLNEYLQYYFKDCINTDQKQVKDIIKELQNLQHYEQSLYLKNLSLQDILKVKHYIYVEKKATIIVPLDEFKEITKEKCNVENIVQNIEILQYLVKQWNTDELEQVEDLLDEFTNSLNMKIYAKINRTDYFFHILTFWKILLEKNNLAKEFNYISNRGYQVLEYFCKNFTELFLEYCFSESINTSLQSMEDVTYVQGRVYEVPHDVVKYQYTEKQFDKIIDVFEKFCEYNLGIKNQWEYFNQFFEFYLMELNQQQFSRVLFISCQTYVGQEKLFEKAQLYLQNLDEKNLDFQTALVSTVFLTLNQNYQNDLWSMLRNKLQQNSRQDLQISSQLNKYLFICKQIHKRKPENYLQSLYLKFDFEKVIIDSTNFSKTLEYYFKYLFLEDIETNTVIDQVNVSYSQGKKALLALERKQICGFTHMPTGEVILAQIFLRNFFNKIEIILITEFNELQKNNDRMHYLRQKIIGWKTDLEAKKNFYNRQVDFVEDKVHISKL